MHDTAACMVTASLEKIQLDAADEANSSKALPQIFPVSYKFRIYVYGIHSSEGKGDRGKKTSDRA